MSAEQTTEVQEAAIEAAVQRHAATLAFRDGRWGGRRTPSFEDMAPADREPYIGNARRDLEAADPILTAPLREELEGARRERDGWRGREAVAQDARWAAVAEAQGVAVLLAEERETAGNLEASLRARAASAERRLEEAREAIIAELPDDCDGEAVPFGLIEEAIDRALATLQDSQTSAREEKDDGGEGQITDDPPGHAGEQVGAAGSRSGRPTDSQEDGSEEVAKIARAFHDEYEAQAQRHGWATQEATRTAFDDLPAANRLTMLATVRALLGRGIISSPDCSTQESGGEEEHSLIGAIREEVGYQEAYTAEDEDREALVAYRDALEERLVETERRRVDEKFLRETEVRRAIADREDHGDRWVEAETGRDSRLTKEQCREKLLSDEVVGKLAARAESRWAYSIDDPAYGRLRESVRAELDAALAAVFGDPQPSTGGGS